MGTLPMVQTDQATLEETDIIVEEPGFYKVVFLNDEVTPVDFVIDILQKVFKHDFLTAQAITMAVHNDGSAVAGVYSYEIAEQKGVETTFAARQSGFPLQVKIEKE